VTRKAGLGRGLDALLPEPENEIEVRRGPTEVGVDSISPSPRQPRQAFDEATLDELASSIRRVGVLQPLLVRRSGPDSYELVAGERRLRAARRAGLEMVPIVEVDADDQGALERALVENLHRDDLNPIEEAAAYRQLLDEGGLTHEVLAERLGKSRVAVTNTLRLLDLPLSVQAHLMKGRLTAGHGRALLGLAGNPLLERLATRAAHEGMSVRDTELLVRRLAALSGAGPGRGSKDHRPPAIGEAQRLLQEHLQTRVRVEMGKKKGRIVVEFVSLEDLERLMGVLGAKRTDESSESRVGFPPPG
jgi:ParB family transcriptional regulator, chromosome partitioning protein